MKGRKHFPGVPDKTSRASGPSTTQLLSIIASPAAPHTLLCPLPMASAYSCLPGQLLAPGPPHCMCSSICVYHIAFPRKDSDRVNWSLCSPEHPCRSPGSSLQNTQRPLGTLRPSCKMATLDSGTGFIVHSVVTKRTVPGTE